MIKRYWQFLKSKKILLILVLVPTLAIAVTVTHQQIADAVRKSPYASQWLKENADAVANLAINVESGGRLDIYNGSCCYGVLQLTRTNIAAFAKMSPQEFMKAGLQTQVNAWAKLTSSGLNHPVARKLASMKTFDGRPVTGELVLACVQMGVGNCNKMLKSGKCSGFKDSLGTTICAMADKMAKGKASKPISIESELPEPPTIFASNFLDEIMEGFLNAIGKWSKTILTAANFLFVTLALIAISWTGIKTFLLDNNNSISDFFAEFLRLMVATGFFYWLLNSGMVLIGDIIVSLVKMGTEATNDMNLSTDNFIQALFGLWIKAYANIDSLDIAEKFVAIGMMAITFIALTLIAANYVLVTAATWIFGYAGIFTLGFGGSRWTSDIAINYFKQLLNLATQLMTMILLMHIAKSIIEKILILNNEFQLFNYVVTMMTGIILAKLANSLPPMVGAVIGGTGNGGIGMGANTLQAGGRAAWQGARASARKLNQAYSKIRQRNY